MGDITDLASSGFETLTIRQVRARPLDLPLRTTIATAQATLTTAPLVLLGRQSLPFEDTRTEEAVERSHRRAQNRESRRRR
jgi:hypothetical protein